MAHEISAVIQSDPDIAVEVYRRMFEYEETSEEETSLGGGVIFTLRGNRRQDFESARYGLEVGFSAFLEIAPVDAAIAAVSSVKAEVGRRKKSGAFFERPQQAFQFEYLDVKVTYHPDFSEIWDSGVREPDSVKFINATFKNISDRFEKDPDDHAAKEMVLAIAGRAAYAVVWKRMLQVALGQASAMYETVYPLLTVPQFISAPETT